MKKTLLAVYRTIFCSLAIFMLSFGARASHIVGLDLHYTWISGDNYKVTLVAYGDCGPASSGSFATLPYSTPNICIYDGGTYITTIVLTPDTPANPYNGREITPVCPADSNSTQCHSTTSTIPGIKQFVYSNYYTMPHHSTHFRFVFFGDMGSGAATGRAAAITNISSGTTTSIQDTLNNSVHNNSNPVLTIVPVPFFCLNNADNYNPGGVDADGDSLNYNLVPGACGSGSGCTSAGFVTYIGGHTAMAPLTTYTGMFSFDHTTGQVSFTPSALQRALVVYNIEEFRHDTLIGTSQREMTFLVLTCTNTPPSGGFDSTVGTGTIDSASHFHICANTDSVFSIYIRPTESDTSNQMYITTTGVPAGCQFYVYNDSTNHPSAKIVWTTKIDSGVTPGDYTFFVVLSDNNCPLSGHQTLAFTISILPIPTVAYTIISPNSCASNAIVSVTPGGLGSPWTVTFQDSATAAVIQNFTGVTSTFLDTVAAGSDSILIFSNVSTFCNSATHIYIPPLIIPTPAVTGKNPTFCGANDGTLHINGLHHSELDTLNYTLNGVPATSTEILTSDSGTIDVSGLCAGIYDNIIINYARCTTSPIGPDTLTNPQFRMSLESTFNPTGCGFNDGSVTLYGLHPGQLDTVFYSLAGVPQAPFVSVVAGDSTIIVPNLYQGLYSSFITTTGGACTGSPYECISNTAGPATLIAPSISCAFDTMIHLGCKGDTAFFTNSSMPLVGLTYRWYFGDGGTDTARNPIHVYHPITAATYVAKLIITNSRCEDSSLITINLPESVHASFTTAPDTICQGSTIAFTNTSIGVSNSYNWYYGDGNTGTSVNGSNTYLNTGSYNIALVAKDHISCLDTAVQNVQVDSNTVISLKLSDSVICQGGLVSFTGDYTTIGLTNTLWTFGDGNSFVNANPIQHAYDVTGDLTATLVVSYRICPQATISRNIRIYPNPSLYLGPDTAICPGGVALTVGDQVNATNPLASWLWNTGETTPGIVIKKPGTYSAVVTIYGCVASDTVVVANDCYADFPNVFSPNGDGINDYFFPRQYLTKGLTEFTMDIYNRWGQLVYTTTGIDGRGWDGNFNGTAQPQGVYIYVVTAKFKDGQLLNKTGNITLVR